MSQGEAAFLGLVLVAFMTFIGVIGFLSIWSRKPSLKKPGVPQAVTRAESRSDNLLKAA